MDGNEERGEWGRGRLGTETEGKMAVRAGGLKLGGVKKLCKRGVRYGGRQGPNAIQLTNAP